ncbi:MAG: GAF domain-containing protein [Timaviella obliquedivisa GSE-PSE-MK23-08B]|nr:GAF domain-containing protein [Timaviella obliquedivisa GSE-PSE-MK23-08B]
MSELLDSTRLLLDLQQVNDIAGRISGCLVPEAIAQQVTDGLVEKFDCAFSRIWLVEPDQSALRLVASSGLYTRIDGSFARVPMGAFKVGKIAKNRIAFLSNNLSEETWVKDREWAIANQIRGFAGYPLGISSASSSEHAAIGVLATFSYSPLTPEFLEVLRFLCTLVTISLNATLDQKTIPTPPERLPLSDQLAQVLSMSPLTLVGTEKPLAVSLQCILLRLAEVLSQVECNYCRLTYAPDIVTLTAVVSMPNLPQAQIPNWLQTAFSNLLTTAACFGGSLQTQMGLNQKNIQVLLTLPYSNDPVGASLYIACRQPLLQTTFIQLAHVAGLQVTSTWNGESPILTDDVTKILSNQKIIWVQIEGQTIPKGIHACVTLSVQASELRETIEAVIQGSPQGLLISSEPKLSGRELEILKLLGQGYRDRDVAQQLVISESTVKFHLNNAMTKLKARTRYQALYQAMKDGWL